MSLLRKAEECIANQKAFARLNAFITPLQQSGLWQDNAREADARKENGSSRSFIDGRFIAVKDNICTRSFPTTCASNTLNKFTSPFNATVVNLLEDAGAIIAGKTNLDEFGMGSHSIHSKFGAVQNSIRQAPDEALSAGGSSGGSAVSVATGQCYAALGTDTGGSVRLPAAYTGTIGFKPSYGLLSRWGVVAYANSLDTVGILANKPSAARNIFDILNQYDPRDPTSISPSSRSRISSYLSSPSLSSRLTARPLRVGVPLEYNISELSPAVRQAWFSALAQLEKQGHSIQLVSLPTTKIALSAYYILAPAEASSNLAKFDGVRYGSRASGPDSSDGPDNYLYAKTRGEGFGTEVKRRIVLGAFSLSADAIDNYFIQSQRVRRLVQRDFDRIFRVKNIFASSPASDEFPGSSPTSIASSERPVDVIIAPTAPSLPPSLSSLTNEMDSSSSSLDAYINDIFTVPASLAGLPAISVPVSIPTKREDIYTGSLAPLSGQERTDTVDTDTVGIQIIGQYGDDHLVLKVAELLEHVS